MKVLLGLFGCRRGFALMEMMVASVILSGLTLGVYQMMSMTNKQQLQTAAKGEVMGITGHVTSILASKESCVETLLGKTITPPGNEVSIIKSKAGASATPVNVYESFSVGQKTYGNNLLKIASMVIIENGGYFLSIDFQYLNNTMKVAGQNKSVIKRVPLQLVLDDAGKVKDCYSDTSNTISTANGQSIQSVCAILGGDMVNGACEGMKIRYKDPKIKFCDNNGNCNSLDNIINTAVENAEKTKACNEYVTNKGANYSSPSIDQNGKCSYQHVSTVTIPDSQGPWVKGPCGDYRINIDKKCSGKNGVNAGQGTGECVGYYWGQSEDCSDVGRSGARRCICYNMVKGSTTTTTVTETCTLAESNGSFTGACN